MLDVKNKLASEAVYDDIPMEHIFLCDPIPMKGTMSKEHWKEIRKHSGRHWKILELVWNHDHTGMKRLIGGFWSKYQAYTEKNPGKKFTAVFVCQKGTYKSVAVSLGIKHYIKDKNGNRVMVKIEHRSKVHGPLDGLCSSCSMCAPSPNKNRYLAVAVGALV